MTIVPRTGPFSASSAFATTSWYQRGKSSAWGVSTPAIAPTLVGRSLRADVLVHQLDALLAGVGVVALLVEQRGTIGFRGRLCCGQISLREGPLDAVLVDELGPLDERVDHLVLGHDRDVRATYEQVATLVP